MGVPKASISTLPHEQRAVRIPPPLRDRVAGQVRQYFVGGRHPRVDRVALVGQYDDADPFLGNESDGLLSLIHPVAAG